MKTLMLSIPVYLLILSPTCGVFGLYVYRSGTLLAVTLVALLSGLASSLTGVLKNSNLALGVSGVFMVIPIIANTIAEPYYTVIDFTLLLLFLEVTTGLTSFSSIAKSMEPGIDENVTYNYRLALEEYTKRVLIIVAITLVLCLGAVFFTANFGTPIGVMGIAFLTMITSFTAFVALALRYHKK
jgi:hypothetical protein